MIARSKPLWACPGKGFPLCPHNKIMGVYAVYIISKAGGLIYSLDNQKPPAEAQLLCKYPPNFVLEEGDRGVMVKFGEEGGVKVGHTLLTVNGQPVTNRKLPDGRSALEFLSKPENYPVSLTFAHQRAAVNERLMLLSMFHSIYAISAKLSPVEGSSGVQLLEADSYLVHCRQTLTGVKFLVVTDKRQSRMDEFFQKMYELYSDFVLKSPFYAMDMPVKSDLFQTNLMKLIETLENSGT